MKKIHILLLLVTALTGFSQTPTYYNLNVSGTSNNIFPFGTTTTRKVQWRISANSLGTLTAGYNITVVYFMTTNTGSNTYPLLNIKMKQNGSGLAGGGNFD